MRYYHAQDVKLTEDNMNLFSKMGSGASLFHINPPLTVTHSEVSEAFHEKHEKALSPKPVSQVSFESSDRSLQAEKVSSKKRDPRLQNAQSFKQIKENFQQRGRKFSSARFKSTRSRIFSELSDGDAESLAKSKSIREHMNSWASFHVSSPPSTLRELAPYFAGLTRNTSGGNMYGTSSKLTVNDSVSIKSNEKDGDGMPTPPSATLFDTIVEGSDIMVTNTNVRTAFVKYIQKRAWVETLMKPIKAARLMSSKADEQTIGGEDLNFLFFTFLH